MTEGASNEIVPFTIDVPQAELDDLRARLRRTRFAQELPDVGWTYGVPTGYLREVVDYWHSGYDWRGWEARFNAYPQFTTGIDGQPIHFFHIRSNESGATPLILFHGWPGSTVEFLDVIEPLTNPVAHGGRAEDAFHVVIPSLPGFGFSGPTLSTGWDARRIALAMAELMARLGYDRYGAQGGDFGAFVAPDLGLIDGDHVIGVHVNAATVGFIPWGDVDEAELDSFTDIERQRIDRLKNFMENNGYFRIQAERPQTIAAGLSDSPAGQLAWIVDKFKEWTFDPAGGSVPVIDRDIILTNTMLYWLTNTAASSARMYYETMHSSNWPARSDVPTGVAAFAEDVPIRRYAERGNNIVRWSDFERGGHFAALEAPDLLVDDIRTFFAGLR